MQEDDCYIQFLETNHYITFGTAIAAFYVPVSVMCFLYWRIWRETEKRQKDLPNLQAGKQEASKRSNSRYLFDLFILFIFTCIQIEFQGILCKRYL